MSCGPGSTENNGPGESAAEKTPDLTGKTPEEANKILTENGYEYKGKTQGGDMISITTLTVVEFK